jgi:hypothetical protein
MSLVHSPEDKIARPILQAVANAIKSLETVTGSLAEHEIGREDDEQFTLAKRLLWSILENNGHTIDIDTNRLRKAAE